MRSFAVLLLLALAPAALGQSPLRIEVEVPGHAAPAIEKIVLTPLEQQLRGTAPVRRLRGLALDGRCLLRLDLRKDADPELARLLVQNRLALVRPKLPPSCVPVLLPPAAAAFVLITVTPADRMSLVDVSRLVDRTITPKLADVSGVAGIRVVGATRRLLNISPDPNKLRAYKLSSSDVALAVQNSLKNVSNLLVMGQRVSIKNEATIEELRNSPIKLEGNVYLRDVAAVTIADEAREHARIAVRAGEELRTRPAVFLLVQLSPGKLNALARKGLEPALAQLRGQLPDGVRCESQIVSTESTTVVLGWPDTKDRMRRLEKAEAAAKAMLELPQVRKLAWLVPPGDSEAVFWVTADSDKKAELHKSLRARLDRMMGMVRRVGGPHSPFHSWPGEGASVVLRLEGDDFAALQQTADKLCQRLGRVAGLVDLDYSPRMRQVATIEIDREKAGLSGVTLRGITQAIAAHADRIELPHFGPLPFITVEVPRSHAKTSKQGIEELELLPIDTINPLVNLIVRDVAQVRLTTVPGSGIPHEDGRACVLVFANLDGRTREEARADIRRIIRETSSKGIHIEEE